MRRPEFTVIAGPNGAGKSSLHPYYVTTPSFDGDKLAMQLRKQYPNWSEQWITSTVASELEKQKKEALAHRKDFAFETNFSSGMVENMIKEFKNVGYKISLCYFGLSSIKESFNRVSQRKISGGHDVSGDVIRFNYYEGLNNCRKHIGLFDKVTFVDSTERYGTVVAIHISNGNIHNVSSAMPEWFKDQFLDVFSELQHISQINNQVIQNEDIIISKANILLQEAVQAVVERIQNPRVRCFSEEQIAVIAKYKNEDDTDDTQNQLLLLWSEVAKELEGKRGIMQKWIDDGHHELIDVWNGNVRESHVGLHRH